MVTGTTGAGGHFRVCGRSGEGGGEVVHSDGLRKSRLGKAFALTKKVGGGVLAELLGLGD